MRLFIFLILYFPSVAFSQDLLVNGGLEEENICTEYNMNCAPEGWISSQNGFDNYFKDAFTAHGGKHCLAIIAGHAKKPYNRTFIRTELLCSLHRGNVYRLSFYIKSRHSILDSIGIYFTARDFLFSNTSLQDIVPSLYLVNANGTPSKDSGWQKVILDYKARGNESFLTIANFAKNDCTGSTHISKENNFFVFLDDISLVPLNTNERLCPDWQKKRQDIYDFDIRHQFLSIYIKEHQQDALPVTEETSVIHADTIVLPGILFETGKASLTPHSFRYLDSLSAEILQRDMDSVVVEGYTDNTGSVLLNEKLSLERANNIAGYLKANISSLLFITRGWGDMHPVADNRTSFGRAQNRRVVVYLYVRQ